MIIQVLLLQQQVNAIYYILSDVFIYTRLLSWVLSITKMSKNIGIGDTKQAWKILFDTVEWGKETELNLIEATG